MNRLDRFIAWLAPRYGLKRRLARLSMGLVEASAGRYRGAEQSRLREDWLSAVLGGTTPPVWELDTLRARSRDLNRNDPVASGATETLVQNIAGQGLRPQARLRAEALGLSEEEAQKLRRRLEAVFEAWTAQADAGGRYDFQEIQFLALRKIIEDGEIIAVPVFLRDSWRLLGRAVELIESDRLVTPPGKDNIIQGVELGPERREPVRYWLRRAAAVRRDYELERQEYIGLPARDARGRPMVLHVFPARRPGQVRGIPYFAPVLSYFKDLADYLEAEVVAARVAACLAVFITKTDPHLEAVAQTSTTETGTGRRVQDIQPGMVSYLNLGEDIKVVDPKRGGETFNSFVEGLLRIIGVSLGLPYELLVKDFSKTNYSSARAALLEGRRLFLQWRSWFARKFCQPLWELVLEEAWLRGLIPVKDFYENRAEYCRAQWIGGSWGWVDPVKEVEASKRAIDYGLSTLAEEAAGQGRDWEEVLEQRKWEQERIAELGLRIPTIGAPKAEIMEEE
ncbi:MAG: phage portal protein [Deltaproteobacteria bacterium]|nr:phage portal protein [Deltaproteobacteria bacterium]